MIGIQSCCPPPLTACTQHGLHVKARPDCSRFLVTDSRLFDATRRDPFAQAANNNKFDVVGAICVALAHNTGTSLNKLSTRKVIDNGYTVANDESDGSVSSCTLGGGSIA